MPETNASWPPGARLHLQSCLRSTTQQPRSSTSHLRVAAAPRSPHFTFCPHRCTAPWMSPVVGRALLPQAVGQSTPFDLAPVLRANQLGARRGPRAQNPSGHAAARFGLGAHTALFRDPNPTHAARRCFDVARTSSWLVAPHEHWCDGYAQTAQPYGLLGPLSTRPPEAFTRTPGHNSKFLCHGKPCAPQQPLGAGAALDISLPRLSACLPTPYSRSGRQGAHSIFLCYGKPCAPQ
jgi:hypothetical protein